MGQTLFEELNPEAFLTSATGLKAIASWWLGGDPNADGLVEEMNNRFDNLIPYDLPPQGERLVKTYPENSQLARYLSDQLDKEREKSIALERNLSKFRN